MGKAENTMHHLTLDMTWTPIIGDERCRYAFNLANRGAKPLAGFSIGFSGPVRIDPNGEIEQGVLLRRLSNFTQVAPPAGFVLGPGESWNFAFRSTSYPLRHWSDAARAAFVVAADGGILPVEVGICASTLAEPGAPRLGPDLSGSDGALPDGLALVPRPAHVSVEGRRDAPACLTLHAASPAGNAFAQITATLFKGAAFVGRGGLAVDFAVADLLPEHYRLEWDGARATISAAGEPGFLHGLVTLGQILHGARADPARCRFPARGAIEDGPAFGWRGMHLDVARQFYELEELRDLLAVMAWNKLNRFHLHLTEDEAWRYEVTAFPELTRIGAFRGYGLPLPPLLGSGAARCGGFYTKDDLRALVALARSYNIETIPEIDVPGHSYAATVALPWLRDPGENAEYRSIQGFPNNCLNVAVPRTMEFMDTVFDELLEIFPGRWIHVGADEVPGDAWTGSPLGRARLAEIGGGGAQQLQADFLRHLHRKLMQAGRITGAWEEGAHGGGVTPEKSYMVAWRHAQIGAELAAQGYDVVMAPGQAYYLDMALSMDWWEPGAAWAGTSSVENTYRFDPEGPLAPEHRHRLLGVQACIWSEPMGDRRLFNRLVFPRLSAIAETGWTPKAEKSWPRFAAAAALMPVLYC